MSVGINSMNSTRTYYVVIDDLDMHIVIHVMDACLKYSWCNGRFQYKIG